MYEDEVSARSITSLLLFSESRLETSHCFEESFFVDERQKDDTLPSVAFAVEVNHKVLGIELGERGIGVLHKSTKRRR